MDTKQKSKELTVQIKARVPQGFKNKIKRLARARMVSESDIIRQALDELIKGEAA